MSEGKAFPDERLQKAEFEKFMDDLKLLKNVFPAQKLAAWMKKDRGNLSKKINGVEPITPKFLRDFYRRLDRAIRLLKQGVPPHEVEREMDGLPEEEAGTFIQLQLTFYDLDLKVKVIQREMVEIRTDADQDRGEMVEVKITLADHAAMIKALQTAVFGSA